jgi:serine/threonine-protein kinase HipA
LTDLPVLLDLAQRAEADTADLPDLQRLVRIGSSLGGARPEAHVRKADGRIAIAKFPSASHDTWNVMTWEKVALDLAVQAGIEVPSLMLLNLAGRSVLILDRFDRTAAGERVGYVSAMTKLEASDGDQRSYLDIAEVIERVSTSATEELHELWRRIVFSIMISNTDDHLRNHGFLHDHDDVWRLATAFDLNPNPAPGPKHLSTAIDDADDTADLAVAVGVAELFRLGHVEARKVLDEVSRAVAQWRDVARFHGLTASDVSAMESAFSVPGTSSQR